MDKICVYPGFNAYYYSFYIQGLYSVFAKESIRYSICGFPKFRHHCLVFVIEGSPEKRVYISASDGPDFNREGLEWSDVYAKVNIDPASIPIEYASKIMAIGPSFSIRIWRPLPAFCNAVKTYWLCRLSIERPKDHFANYWRQFRYRLPEYAFRPGISLNDYVFFATSLWKRENETNNYRALFIKACRSLADIRFEGGFDPRAKRDMQGFEDITLDKRYSFCEYVEKTKTSAVVFNTPAVHKCHGWKLGEYLALGKAIISTPLFRQLPAPLIHGEHIHYVDGSFESIRDAVHHICKHVEYRKKLELGAREYYLRYLCPSRVIQRILKAV